MKSEKGGASAEGPLLPPNQGGNVFAQNVQISAIYFPVTLCAVGSHKQLRSLICFDFLRDLFICVERSVNRFLGFGFKLSAIPHR